MNTGVQRSGATPPAARTATTQAVGAEPGNVFGQGKNAPLIAMAHEIPYVATATVADLRDLEAKVEHAMELHGARYLHVLVPCPLGWGSRLARHDPASRGSRSETGLFPVFEAEHGEVTARLEDPPPGAGRGVPAAAAALRAPVRPERRRRRDRAHPGARRPQHRAASGCSRGGAVMDKPFAITLDVGSSLANKTGSWRTERPVYVDRLPPCNHACPAGENIQALALPRRGRATTRRAWRADHGGQPAARRHGPRLLPPVRDRLQPRPARRGGRHQLGRALPRRRGDQAGLDASTSPRAPTRQARAGRRRRARPGCRPPTTCARLGHAVDDPRRRPARRRHDALRHPDATGCRATCSTPRSQRILDLGVDARARHARSTTSRDAMREGGFDAAFLAVGAHIGKRAYIPAGEAAHDPRRGRACCAAWRARSRRCSAGASSSTAAATPRWTRRAPPSGSAPRRRSSSTAAPASGCPRTTSRSRRRSRRAC